MCHVSRVTCHMSHVFLFYFTFFTTKKNIKIKIIHSEKIGQSGEASRWRVCYQRGLPRLVLLRPHGLKHNRGDSEATGLFEHWRDGCPHDTGESKSTIRISFMDFMNSEHYIGEIERCRTQEGEQ